MTASRVNWIKTALSESGSKVVYWMQSAQRIVHNHALSFAIEYANEKKLPLEVVFVIMPNFPNANKRHFRFMLEGLEVTSKELIKLGCRFRFTLGAPETVVENACRDAMLLVMDDAYLRYERQLKQHVSERVMCAVAQVTTNVVVPVTEAYPKSAYGAYVLRPSIHKKFSAYFDPAGCPELICKSEGPENQELPTVKLISELSCDDLPASKTLRGGFEEAMRHLHLFIETKCAEYATLGNNPDLAYTSNLSPYLHFGQISPITILEALYQSGIQSDAFFEQLVVRRELAYNYVYYEPDYDQTLEAILPMWALETLQCHADDPRPWVYDLDTFSKARTHDPYWNAAQNQLLTEGIMHNYMRMYWGKKILEWTASPEEAFRYMCQLNDMYALDGRDPNGYAGIAWCFGKHDRPWQERSIFGKVRYMNAAGLTRKFKMDAYVLRYREAFE